MKILRHHAGFVPLDRQVEVTYGTGHRRGGVGPSHRFPVDRRVGIQKIAGQHVQRGIVGQGKAKRLRVVGIVMNSRELVGYRRFRLDARNRFHTHWSITRS